MRALSFALLLAGACLTVGSCGCQGLNLFPSWFQDEEETLRENVRAALRGEEGHSRLVGDYIRVADSSVGSIRVHGVGLVDRLNGTGDNPPESPYRDKVLAEMRIRKIPNPEQFLAQSSTTIVLVTAYIRPTMNKGQTMDVEVTLPEGSSVTSIAGGYLLPCRLTEMAFLGGQTREGKVLAEAAGPILVTALNLDGDDSDPEGLRRGTIPGGARYIGEDRDLKIGIRSDYRTVRMSTQLANRIGTRFYDYDKGGIQQPMANALTNVELELQVHSKYKDNYWRYLNVIRHITLNETEVQRHLRLSRLKDDIMQGPTAEKAALELEAIGNESLPMLRAALQAESLEARFRAAESLAYLGHADGVAALKEAADKEPAFRMYALAAMSTLDDGKAADALRDLMNHSSVETRYGAFRALHTMFPDDPSVDGVRMPGGFTVHPVDSTADPLIHLTRVKKSEIVLFDATQKFQLPLMLRAGSRVIIKNNSRGDGIVLSRIVAGEGRQERTTSTEIGQVIKAAAELGASYPDVVQMLLQAERQHNLPGLIAIDELPAGGRTYLRPETGLAVNPGAGDEVQVGNELNAPDIFEEKVLVAPETAPQNSLPANPNEEDLHLKNENVDHTN